jgi:hypothetical protein
MFLFGTVQFQYIFLLACKNTLNKQFQEESVSIGILEIERMEFEMKLGLRSSGCLVGGKGMLREEDECWKISVLKQL